MTVFVSSVPHCSGRFIIRICLQCDSHVTIDMQYIQCCAAIGSAEQRPNMRYWIKQPCGASVRLKLRQFTVRSLLGPALVEQNRLAQHGSWRSVQTSTSSWRLNWRGTMYSWSSRRVFFILLRINDKVKHIKILTKDGCFYIAESRLFKSVLVITLTSWGLFCPVNKMIINW